ncbi:biotin-dependent carboxyltransferase family protein [Thalassotalea maritima]|uniref:5-oxoprolinase subunit C family protein n=1 Tax=Thalassotalea maritima TaxID=3242416 RepID=UPI0035285142
MNHLKTLTVNVIKSGPLMLFQDLGRPQVQNLGFASCGAADEYAYMWANKLVANPVGTPTLEVTFGQAQLQFSDACTIAMTGANCNARIVESASSAVASTHSQYVAIGKSIKVNKGQILQLQAPKTGLRTYIAIAGRWQVPTCHHSAATNINEPDISRQPLGLHDGSKFSVSQCDVLQGKKSQQMPLLYQVDYSQELLLRFNASLLWQQQAAQTRKVLSGASYQIDSASNRMGYRLNGKAIELSNTPSISRPTCFGAIQIASNGQPMVLLKDRQTIGGYPVIGSVLHKDACRLSQLRPGQRVRFMDVSQQLASEEMTNYYQFFFAPDECLDND